MEDGEPESRQLRPRYAVSRSCFRISSRNANAPPTTVSGLQSRKLSKVRAARASSGALSQRASPKKPTDGYVQVLEVPARESARYVPRFHPEMNTFSLLPSRSRKYPA